MRRSKRRAALILLAALALSGCFHPALRAGCGQDERVPPDFPGQGANVTVYVSNDAQRDATFCVQFGDGGVLRQESPAGRTQPNVAEAGRGNLEGASVIVTAWIAGTDVRANATFPLHEQNYFVVTYPATGALRIERYDQRPAFM